MKVEKDFSTVTVQTFKIQGIFHEIDLKDSIRGFSFETLFAYK